MATLKNAHSEMQLQVENDLICTYIKQPHILSLLTADLKQKPYAHLQNTSISAQLAADCLSCAPRRTTNVNPATAPLIPAGPNSIYRRSPPIKTKKSTPWHQKSGEITQ